MSDSAFRCFACMRPIASAQAVCPHCGHDNHVRDNGPGYLPELVLQNQYLVGRMLGHGGFGVTYLGYDLALDRVVAIKEYFPRELALRDSQSVSLAAYSDHVADFKSGCERALRESRMAAGLGHIPNIVSVYNAVMANNTVYIIMEYIDGETLTGYVKKNGGRLPLAQALRLLTPIASALTALHARGVIHRDVKPDNIMVRWGSDNTVLLDFGAARTLDNRTMSLSSLIYSPGYAPPEQCSALAVMDARVDQYAFCATLYFALTGQTPMDCQLRLFTSRDITPIHTLNDSVSPAAEAVIMRGMAVKAEDRYPGMAGLMDALQRPEPRPEPKPELKPEPEPKSEPEPELKPEPEPKSEPEPETETETKSETVIPSEPAARFDTAFVMKPLPDEPEPEPEPKPRRSKAPIIAVAAALLAGCGFLTVNGTTGGSLLSEFIPAPTAVPTTVPTAAPTAVPTAVPTAAPTAVPDYALADSFRTEKLNSSTLSIEKYIGSDTIVRIPPTINGKAVKKIGSHAFAYCSSLAQVNIPDSVTEIGDSAFAFSSSLAQVSIPDSVTEIGNSAFYECSSLKQVNIPNSVTSISARAFEGCSSLKQVNIPNSVTSIGYSAFWFCKSLAQLVIPDSVTFIDVGAFCGCKSLAQVNIPNSVTEISSHAFSSCNSLAQVTIPDSVTKIGEDAFSGSSLTQVDIPDSVTSIGNYAFEECTSLTSVRLPGSLRSLGNNPFRKCKNLAEIIVPPDLEHVVFEDGFLILDSTKLVGYYLPGSKKASIPDSVTEIGHCAFFGCSSLAQVDISDSVKTIGNFAFSDCSSLAQVSIPGSVTKIGDYAFRNCVSLKQVSIPKSVREIDEYAFFGCSSNLTLQVKSGSYAEKWAKKNKIAYETY